MVFWPPPTQFLLEFPSLNFLRFGSRKSFHHLSLQHEIFIQNWSPKRIDLQSFFAHDFGVNTQTHHGNVALPFLRCLKVYLMRWRFFGGSKSWPLFQSDHFFFFLFGYQQGEGEGFYHHNLSKLQIFQICFVACSLTPRYKYLIVNRPLGDEVFRPKRKVSSEKTMQKHRWKFESKILRLRLRGCCQKAVGKPHAYNMYKHAYKTHINTQYIGIFGMYVPLSKLHKCR